MIIFIVLLFALAIYKCKLRLDKGFYEDYASIEQSRSINGICIMLILLSHTFAKVAPQGVLDEIYEPMRIFLGQFVVVPFLFYSGYGIMESLSKKDSFIKTFPKRRFLKIVVQFFIITLVYIVLHLLINSNYSLPYILLSFTGITSIGNGGWYILSTFVFYTAIIIAFNLFKKNKIFAVLTVTAILAALMATEMLLDFPTYYYNTTIFFAVGMFYSLLKSTFDKIVMKNNFTWAATLAISLLGFVFLKSLMDKSVIFYPIWCGMGMLMILTLTMKVRIQNKALIWLGKTTFFNFTLQGISQIVFTKYLTNNYLIYVLVIVVSLTLTFCADYLFKKGEKLLSKRGA